jgi:hypothetical protein
MKRFLLACLGMVLLGAAGLILLHEVVDSPPRVQAQAGGGPGGVPPPAVGGQPPGAAGQPGDSPGQYKEIVPALLGALADADGSVRQLAAATLVKVGPDAVPPLVEALKAKDRDTRANAAYVLGHLGELAREALPALAKTLKDEDKDVRRRAAYAIHNIVSRSESAAAGGAGPAGAPGDLGSGDPPLLAVPMRGAGAGPLGPGMLGASDPGLLLPAESPAAKPAKGKD